MRNGLKWILPFMLLLCVFSFKGRAQNSSLDSLENKVKTKLSTYYKRYPQEKIFLHTNQRVYAGGQIIWYKLYSMAYGRPSSLSKIAYVQLINSAGHLEMQDKLPLKNGFAQSDMKLPEGLKSGWYQLKGFTAWMMNFNDSAYYRQNIYVQNVADSLPKGDESAMKKFHISFYPEGGDMVDGNPCKVAFKAVDDAGLPVIVYGDVLDNNKKTVAKLETAHDGMGVFNVEPLVGMKYTATVYFPDKTVQHVALPDVKKEGMSMQVYPEADDVGLNISYTGPAEKYGKALLTAVQNNGKIITYPIELDHGVNPFSIPKKIFSTGILRLTLFDHSGAPAAERIVYIDKHDQLDLQLKADTVSAGRRSKQVFSFFVKGTSDQSSMGSYSVSVTDADAGNDQEATGDNIASYLLVNSELKGTIHNAGWYFTKGNDSLHQNLDLIMLTNGWRHFKWTDLAEKSAPVIHYPVEGPQYIAGRIIDYHAPLTEKEQLTIKLIILNQDSSKYLGYVTPDSTGSFILKDYDHKGISTLFMEASDKKNNVKKLKIRLYSTMDDSLRSISYAAPGIQEQPAVTADLLSRAKAAHQSDLQLRGINLNAVFIKDKKLTPTEEVLQNHVSSVYVVDKEYTLDLVNNPTVDMSLVDYIRGRFPGLRIDQDATGIYFTYMTSNTLMRPKTAASGTKDITGASNADLAKPYVFLNESQVPFAEVQDIPLQDVALIRFAPPPVFFAPYNGGNVGALLIYTRNSSDQHSNRNSREQFGQYTFEGYAITREFSSPDYSVVKNAPVADNRTTLYWNPDLVPDAGGHVKFHFYNSDKAKRYRVVIQGMAADGKLGVLEEVF